MANVITHRPASAAKRTATPGANILALDAFVRSVTVNAQVGCVFRSIVITDSGGR
jgi:hypothetical protein